MRLIDAGKLCEEFKMRQKAALNWKEQAIMNDNLEAEIRADAVLAFLSEVKLTIEKAPTINPFYPIPAETMYKIMDSEFEASNSFWIETPKGKKIEFEKVRPRGHWEIIGYHADKYFYCKCSNCKKKTKVFYDKTNPGEFGSLADIRRNVHFCMFCGADMREEQEDET